MPFETPRAQIKQPIATNSPSAGVSTAQEADSFLEEIAKYNEFGKILRRESLRDVGQRLAKIAEMAEVAVTNEASDWFDAHTLKRNMKEVKSYASEFMKLAEEADSINQRMSAYYDDMGRILERYFEIPDTEVVDPTAQMKDRGEISPEDSELDQPHELKESDLPVYDRDPKVYAATPVPPVTPDPKEMDALTLRAIKAVHKRLKHKNPSAATRFANLPPEKMKEIVWTLATKV